MASLTAIREGLAKNLSAIPDLQVSPYRLANPSPPAALIYPGDPGGSGVIMYDVTFARGTDLWPFTVQVFVGLASDIGSQVKLEQYMASSGPLSVKTVLEADDTLGGVVHSLQVNSCTGDRVYVRERGAPVLGAEWRLEIYAPGT